MQVIDQEQHGRFVGHGREQVIDLSLTIAFYCGVVRLLATLQIDVEPEYQPYLDEFPLPNGPNRGQGLALLTFPFNQNLRQDFGQMRVDQNFGAGDRLFVRYTGDDANQYLPTDFPQFPRYFLSRNQFVTADYSRTISPRTGRTTPANSPAHSPADSPRSRTAAPRSSVRAPHRYGLSTPLR